MRMLSLPPLHARTRARKGWMKLEYPEEITDGGPRKQVSRMSEPRYEAKAPDPYYVGDRRLGQGTTNHLIARFITNFHQNNFCSLALYLFLTILKMIFNLLAERKQIST